jgi:hypothetical protein
MLSLDRRLDMEVPLREWNFDISIVETGPDIVVHLTLQPSRWHVLDVEIDE